MVDKINEEIAKLTDEYNNICNAMENYKQAFESLGNRKKEIEGAMKSLNNLLGSLSTPEVTKNDTESNS